jgi:fructose-1,6-bisphosphatase/inositol monophosphatase family enzyme
VASGYADLDIEAGLGIYDYVAVVPVLAGAGGLMTDWHGNKLTLVSDGRVVAAGDARAHAAAIAALAG